MKLVDTDTVETRTVDPMMLGNITYEQPLNEPVRLCLRLEHLFEQLRCHLKDPSTHASQMAMTTLLKILNVTERPDLKSKLSQSLNQQASVLAQLERVPQVDTEKLQRILGQLDQSIDFLHQLQGKVGDPLRGNPFLNQIRLHLGHPAGPCNFSTPAYALWLQQLDEKRMNDLFRWANELEPLASIVSLILRLTRESAPTQQAVATKGFFQQSLDTHMPCQMVRVTLPVKWGVYPEISVGKHRLAIRFLILNPDNLAPPQQWQDDVSFALSCCRV